MVWLGVARPGWARHGRSRRDKHRGMAWQGLAGLGWARHGKVLYKHGGDNNGKNSENSKE